MRVISTQESHYCNPNFPYLHTAIPSADSTRAATDSESDAERRRGSYAANVLLLLLHQSKVTAVVGGFGSDFGFCPMTHNLCDKLPVLSFGRSCYDAVLFLARYHFSPFVLPGVPFAIRIDHK